MGKAISPHRVRTLDQVGRMVHAVGLASKPLRPDAVLFIERRAMAKVENQLASCFSSQPGASAAVSTLHESAATVERSS